MPLIASPQHIVRQGGHRKVVGTDDTLIVVFQCDTSYLCKEAILGRRLHPTLVKFESLIATGLPHRAGDDFAMPLRVLAALMPRTAGIRRAGAAALDLAYVAAGFADGFFERGLKPWDVAAGALLVTEAGGLIGNFAGGAFDMDAGECLAASPRIYAQLVSILSPYSRFGETENVPATRAKGTLKATAAKEESDEEKTGENEEQSK